MSFAGKWMELEIIMLSEIRQTQKQNYHMCSLKQARSNKKVEGDN
jgi:hypothetical protein